MNRISLMLAAFTFVWLPQAVATPVAAERAKKAYELGVERWVLETRLADTAEERAAAAGNRPDPAKATREVWQAIAAELDREWTLPYSAWFIRMADGLGAIQAEDGASTAAFEEELAHLLAAIEKFHLDAEGLAPVCMALAGRGNPQRLTLLGKIRSGHPEDSVRGIAALAEAMAMKALGDEPTAIARRLQLLRQAIIHSADVKVHEDTTVGDIAAEELYVISHLTKGRKAPDLAGRDTAGRMMRLSDHAGKVVILLFWSATDPGAREVIEFAAGLHGRLRGQPIELIGVNTDATAILRPMEADGRVTWRNFSDPSGNLAHEFRVGYTPLCFVLDGKRTIQHIGPPGAFVELAASATAEELE